MSSPLLKLFNVLPQVGTIQLICLRPDRRIEPINVEEVEADETTGLIGDHYRGTNGKRQVTLIQAEHLEAVSGLLGGKIIDPLLTRRNLVVSGINLLALKKRQFSIGEVILEMTGPCEPCSRMEEHFGPGGYNAMRGHGGICARVIKGGTIRLNDEVKLLD